MENINILPLLMRSSASIRIGYTKILAHTWMEGLMRMVSGKQDERKLVYFLTQLYAITSSQVRERFVSTLAAELEVRRGQKWNAEQVIVFQTVILQRVHIITGAKNICTIINIRLNLWNSREFDELVIESYAASTGY